MSADARDRRRAGSGQAVRLATAVVIGRDNTADLVIDDSQASRRHARIEPTGHGAIVEDMRSTNGTFINDNELHGRAELGPDDELLIGVTVMQVRTSQAVQRQPSAVRAVPAFATPESRPTFTEPVGRRPAAPPRPTPACPSSSACATRASRRRRASRRSRSSCSRRSPS